MQIKNKIIRALLTKTTKTAVPFPYIMRNQSQFAIKPKTWESCDFCSVKRQKRFMYQYQKSQTLCRECTETALTVKAVPSTLSETTRSVIMNNFNWLKGRSHNLQTNRHLGQIMDLFDIGLNIEPALSLLLNDKLPRGGKELLTHCIGPLLRIFEFTDPTPKKIETLIFTKERS